ncbi:Carboxypeptidase A4 [Podila epigama]|nr:Carboxypeptidase A4 [Podila epigama]
MRCILTTIPLALTLSVVCLAYPMQSNQQQHQLTFSNPHRLTPDVGATPPMVPPAPAAAEREEEGDYVRFDGDKVLRIEISSLAELKKLEAIVETHNLDLWSNLRIGPVDVRVPTDFSVEAMNALKDMSLTVMIPDVQELVPDQAPLRTLGQWNYTDDSFWAQYHDYATLNNFTETLIAQYPNLTSRVSVGHTFEGREVFGISIHGHGSERKASKSLEYDDEIEDAEIEIDFYSDENDDKDLEDIIESWWSWLFGSSKKAKEHKHKTKSEKKIKKHKKKAIVIHGGQHAREWIGPAVVSYIARELLTGYGSHKKITRLVDQFEFIIIPVLNADGYAYTWSTNRMWRKNRQPTSIPFCKGIDPNRNWGYMWNNGGSSNNPCSDAYHGPEPFAANEPKMIADYITQKGNVVSFIDFHAYSQLWMSPFGADCSKTPKDNEDIIEAAMGAAKALKDVHGTKFAVGSVCNIIYQASGGSLDWTYGEAGVKYSYAVELRDTGKYGFMLPENQILPSAQETFAGFLHLVNFIRKREKQWRW